MLINELDKWLRCADLSQVLQVRNLDLFALVSLLQGSDGLVVEHQLQPLLAVVVTKLLKSGPSWTATRSRVLEAWCVHHNDGGCCVGRGSNGSENLDGQQ